MIDDERSIEWIVTQDGTCTLKHVQHGQSYHSLAGAWSECEHVFLQPVKEHASKQKWSNWCVLDVGFGLGLNWLCFVDYTQRLSQPLTIHSLENDERVLRLPQPPHLENRVLPQSLKSLNQIKSYRHCESEHLSATLHFNEAHLTLENWQQSQAPKFNIVLQDAFSAQVNPKLWDEDYFKKLATVCSSQAIVVTYASASSVQKALKVAGFEVTKYPGFGGKRERLVAVKCVDSP